MKSELTKALEYERTLQKRGLLKNIKMYNAMLDEYASLRGFWNFDHLIQELSND